MKAITTFIFTHRISSDGIWGGFNKDSPDFIVDGYRFIHRDHIDDIQARESDISLLESNDLTLKAVNSIRTNGIDDSGGQIVTDDAIHNLYERQFGELFIDLLDEHDYYVFKL